MSIKEQDLQRILSSNPDLAELNSHLLDDAAPSASSSLAAQFLALWRKLDGPPLETEYVFYPGRRWRFDFACVPAKVAIELNGGVWSRGRHVRGGGYLRDREKANAAQSLGWRVFELGTGQVTEKNVKIIIGAIG